MKNVMVVGSINMDVVLTMERAPLGGESVYCRDRMLAGGGKGANQALTLHGLGVPVIFCGAVGRDSYGEMLLAEYESRGLDSNRVLRKDEATGTAYILLEDGGENRILVLPGANETFCCEDVREKLLPLLKDCSLLLLQLEIPLDTVSFLLREAAAMGVRAIVDAGPIRGCRLEQLKGAWCISPNRSELTALTGVEPNSQEELERGCRMLLDSGAECVLVKLGCRGSFYMDAREQFMTPAFSVTTVDTTAAGDSFTAGFAAGLWAGLSPREAVAQATECGALAVMKKGAYPSLPTKERLAAFRLERGEGAEPC